MAAKLQKTSVQLSAMVLSSMDSWPGLTRSEALRLSIERGHYLSTLKSEEISDLASDNDPILQRALEDLSYEDYKLVVRSLPSLVTGFLCEESQSWRADDGSELKPGKLVEQLQALNPLERIGVLDCVVAERHRKAAKRNSQK